MSRSLKSLLVLLAVAAVPVALGGCGNSGGRGPGIAEPDVEIKLIFENYLDYTARNKKPPTKTADLMNKHMEVTNLGGVNAIKSKKFVVVWGVPMGDKMAGGDPETVLIYDKDAPTNGGSVMMADGNIRTMSAAELSAKIKK